MAAPDGPEQVACVLIVEDIDDQRHALRELLQEEGFRTLDCATGEEALVLARREQVAVAVVDARLPDISGPELIACLKEVDESLRTIIHTAYGSFVSAKAAVNLGVFAYVEKSGDLTELIRHIRRAASKWAEQGRFDRMVVELKEARDQLSRRERLVILGQLAGSVAHEIRNPLGVMKNSIYFLRLTQKLQDKKAIQHLGLIEDEIIKTNRIITELLDYARDPVSQIGQFVLQEAFYKALAVVEVPESVQLEHEFGDDPLTARGDSGQVERILANFLRNAIQAMPEGGTLRMECRRAGGELIADIHDTGVGIAEDDLGKIFEPLYTGKAKGIGLGLPLSQRYAQLNDGRIECESRLGEGSTFRLILQAAEGEQDAAG
ncbi:MAG: ATP-binding protein [Acidobacteriota bacterium]